MQPTDLGDRVAAQRELRGASWFSDLAPTLGRDPESGLELEVDVTGWPTRVTRLDAVVDALRDEAGLLRAVRRAVGGAALAHLAAVAHGRGLPPDRVARGEELVAGRRRLTPPPTYRSPLLAPPRDPVHPRAWRADERWGRTATGRSREGEVVVVLGWVGGLRELHADEGFLRSTSPDLLRYALTEAFTAAQEGPRA